MSRAPTGDRPRSAHARSSARRSSGVSRASLTGSGSRSLVTCLCCRTDQRVEGCLQFAHWFLVAIRGKLPADLVDRRDAALGRQHMDERHGLMQRGTGLVDIDLGSLARGGLQVGRGERSRHEHPATLHLTGGGKDRGCEGCEILWALQILSVIAELGLELSRGEEANSEMLVVGAHV